jgi:hypothetical protein
VPICLFTEAMERNRMDGGDHDVKSSHSVPKFVFSSGPIHPA